MLHTRGNKLVGRSKRDYKKTRPQ